MTKKLSHQLTDEELLEQLSSDEDVAYIDGENDLLNFCAVFNLRSGKILVNNVVLFELYKVWSKNPVTLSKFKTTMGQLFTVVNVNKQQYAINQEPAALLTLQQELKKKKTIAKVKSPRWKQHFQAFLDHYSLANGKVWIEGDILFWLYSKWSYQTRKTLLLGYQQFLSFLTANFKKSRKTVSRIYWFRVNSKLFDHLTQEFIRDFRDKRKLTNASKKRTKKNKTE